MTKRLDDKITCDPLNSCRSESKHWRVAENGTSRVELWAGVPRSLKGMVPVESMEIANRAGVPLVDLESLARGQPSPSIAQRLGISVADLDSFLRGAATVSMTNRLGLTAMNSARELARLGGIKGAIGIVLGLLLSSAREGKAAGSSA
jgi:hypothetical protein